MANLLSTIVDGQITVNSGRLLLQTGGLNTYGIISGYNNNNHFITMRGSVSGSTTSPTLSGVHQMTFVEYAEANDSTGWYFKSSSSGTYEEIARITRSGINWNGNTVIHSGNIGSQSVSYASSAGYSDEAKWISYPDGPRDLSDRSPIWNNRSVAWDFVGAATANGSGNYGGVMTFVPWDGTSASTGDSSYQLAFANTTGVNASGQPKLSIRNGINSTWNAWYTLIHSGNIGSQSVSYATSAGSAGSVQGYSAYSLIEGARGTHSGSDFPNGTLVTTDIPAQEWAGDSFVMEVSGKSYDAGNSPFKLIMQGYLYADTVINVSAMSYGSYFPSPVKVMNLDGNLAFWWPRGSYWNSFEVHVRDAGGSSGNRVTGIGNSVDPPEATKKVSCTPIQVIHTNNIGSQSVNYATSAGSATTATTAGSLTSMNISQFTNNSGYITSVGNITRLWAESHPTDYYVRANWTGSYWQLTSNHPSPVQVGYADNAGSATTAGALTSMNISQFTNNSGYITSVPNLQYGGGDSLTGAGTATTWDPRGTTYDRYVIGNHTGISLHGYPGYGGVRLYAAGYPTLTTSVLRLEASDAVYTFGGLYSDGNAVIHAGNIGSQSVADASTLGGFGRGNTTNKVAYFDGARNLYVNNPETYTGEVRLGAAWNRGGVYASNTLTMSTSSGAIDFVSNDTILGGFRWASTTGSRFIVGEGVTTTPYTLIDTNKRPVIYARGPYPVLTLDHTETSNAEHGPTIQFTFNGSNARQWVIGCGGSGNFMDFGFSSSGYGNANYNPHNGISGYQGNTIMRIIDSRVGIGGDWGAYGSVANPEHTLDVRGTIFSNTDMRAPIFYDSNDTAFYVDPNSSSRLRNLYVGDSGSNWVDPDGWGTQLHVSNGPHSIIRVYARNEAIQTVMYSHAGGLSKVGSGTNHDFTIVRNFSDRMTFYSGYTYANGYLQAADSLRAPVFYDSDDTGFYLDPNGTSNLIQLTESTRARWNMPRIWHDRSSRTSDQGYWTGTNGWATEDGTWANAWRGGFSGWDIWGNGTDHPQGAGYVHAQGIVSGQHYTTSSVGYGWMMVGAANATANRYWLRGKWDTTTSAWVEMITTGNIGSQSVSYADSAGSAPNSGNINPFYNVTAGVGNGLRFWGGSDEYKISMGVGGLYQYGPVTDYSIKTQMDPGSTGRGFTWGNNGVTPVAALNATSGNFQVAGTIANGSIWINNGANYNDYNENIRLFDAPNGVSVIAFSASGTGGSPRTSLLGFSDRLETRVSNTWEQRIYGGYVEARGSFRAPIFYDSNDTGYYGDFAGFSRMSEIGVTNDYVYNYDSIESPRSVAEFGNVGKYVATRNAVGDYPSFSFEHVYGTHSWGQIARFHIRQSGADRPSIQFSSGSSNTRWNIGYCTGSDDNFRIVQNMGYRPDNSGVTDSWGTERFRINTDGSMYCLSSFTASGDVTAYSDIRVKENIEVIPDAIKKVKSIRGVTFTRTDNDDNKKYMGVIAQELLDVIPEVVSETDSGMYTVAYGNITALLIEAIKEQQAQIDELKAKLDGLTK